MKKPDGTAASSERELLAEWKEYFSSLLIDDNGPTPADIPPPTEHDLPICVEPPTLQETKDAIQSMKSN